MTIKLIKYILFIDIHRHEELKCQFFVVLRESQQILD